MPLKKLKRKKAKKISKIKLISRRLTNLRMEIGDLRDEAAQLEKLIKNQNTLNNARTMLRNLIKAEESAVATENSFEHSGE